MYGSDYMNKIKTILIGILSTICFMLAIVCVFLALAKDDTPPEITFDDIILSYTEGDDTSILFTGVSASDLVDGDVTDRMIIKSITMEKDGFATVTYAVTDTSNNLTLTILPPLQLKKINNAVKDIRLLIYFASFTYC